MFQLFLCKNIHYFTWTLLYSALCNHVYTNVSIDQHANLSPSLIFKGRVHERAVEFCDCFKEPVTLLKLGFWASSSVKPSTAYNIQFLESMVSLMLECQVSVLGYVNAIRWKNMLSKAQVCASSQSV